MKIRVMNYRLHPELEVTGQLYHRLLLLGIDAHLEVRLESSYHRSNSMRADIAILDKNKKITSVIECKRFGKKIGENTRQARAYREFVKESGARMFYVNSQETLESCVKSLGEPD